MTAPTKTMTVVPNVPHLEPKARFADLLAAEWIKLWSLRSTPWAFAATVVAVLATTVAGAVGDSRNYTTFDAPHQEYFRMFGAVGDSFSTGAATMLILGVGAIGAITILGEYTSGMIRTTFTAVPARRSVMAAKVAVVTASATAFGAALVLVSYCVTQVILSGDHASAGLGHSGVVRMLVASSVLAPVSALVGMGLAAVIRHSVLTIVVTIALFFILPSLLDSQKLLTVSILHMTILQAWGRICFEQSTTARFPWTVPGACLVLAIWGLVSLVLAIFTSNHRDQ
ncbi:ABC transporter permease [Kitasatospora sp. NBC_01287]|uniref:ABC transporter permease n=1 Tax=Kitasatospora sp. NBC_01287 TaxID=2903573 RepID=UPI002258E6BA|nr:ABC transporter permease [Kitasatospora sp. NBC_01287]MCX4750436.1 ABC transporter permease [Kitasatospora sp. NBC_01287]